jgi:pSer/pThr/pTyr-binding forkhead associated (FHA) protein
VETIKTKQNEMFKIRPVTQSTPSSLGVFGRGRILIGRSESCDYVINSETVSAIHAVMEIFNDRAVIYDMNSTNGTYVNNEKVIVKEFKHGSTFRISELEFEFELEFPELSFWILAIWPNKLPPKSKHKIKAVEYFRIVDCNL